MKKLSLLSKLFYGLIRISMLTLIIVFGVRFLSTGDAAIRSNSLFVCGQSALFLLVSSVPLILKKLGVIVPDFVYIIFGLFCTAHFVLGEILGFFASVKWWDSALHTISGMLITILSFSVISLFNKKDTGYKPSVGFACLFAFCLATTVGVVWEIVEFAADQIFDLNMQRAYVSTVSGERGIALAGTNALKDTMKDFILNSVGALVVSVGGLIIAKKKGLGVESFVFIKRREGCQKGVNLATEDTTLADNLDAQQFESEQVEEQNK